MLLTRLPLFLLLIGLLFTACSEEEDSVATTAPSENPAAVAEYLNEVVALMERNSINRYAIDWTDFRQQVLDAGASASAIRFTNPAFRRALALLGDNHSFVVRPNGTALYANQEGCPLRGFSVPELPSSVGYVRVPTLPGGHTPAFVRSYVAALRDSVRVADRPDLDGWIVDLRGNLGGNMWPMLAGIGPILGEGTLGYFIDPDSLRQTWTYRGDGSYLDDQRFGVAADTFRLSQELPRVAVLTDAATASSGEAVAIAFRGRPNTRSFGVPTCGISTANTPFVLSDGTTLQLTTAYMADRNARIYGVAVQPNEVVESEADLFERALAYLRE